MNAFVEKKNQDTLKQGEDTKFFKNVSMKKNICFSIETLAKCFN